MSLWVIKGIRTGIKTIVYPRYVERAAGVTPGLPCGGEFDLASAKTLVDCCPAQVFDRTNGKVSADSRRCTHCYRCVRGIERPANWEQTYEWATVRNSQSKFNQPFQRSIHICVVDAGDCGACLNEVKQLNNPYYNMHRLGFFITPSPRHADVLLVVGPVTDHIHADRIEFTAAVLLDSLCYGLVILVPLLSTPHCCDAVTVRYRTILHSTGADSHRSIPSPSQAH
jgi:hypothetical protein